MLGRKTCGSLVYRGSSRILEPHNLKGLHSLHRIISIDWEKRTVEFIPVYPTEAENLVAEAHDLIRRIEEFCDRADAKRLIANLSSLR